MFLPTLSLCIVEVGDIILYRRGGWFYILYSLRSLYPSSESTTRPFFLLFTDSFFLFQYDDIDTCQETLEKVLEEKMYNDEGRNERRD